jgi:hypothetical protein
MRQIISKGGMLPLFKMPQLLQRKKFPLDQLPSRYTRNFELVRYEEMSRLAGRSI